MRMTQAKREQEGPEATEERDTNRTTAEIRNKLFPRQSLETEALRAAGPTIFDFWRKRQHVGKSFGIKLKTGQGRRRMR